MGRYLKQYEKENMRMAMLKQEETFRHQVHELHRLYRVQKVLVNDMKQRKPSNSGTNKLERWNIDSEITTSQQQQRPCYSSSPALNLDLPAAEEYIGKDEDGDHVVMLGADEDSSELELTLAIGSSKISTRKKEKYSSTTTTTSDSGASFSSSSSSISDYYSGAAAAKMKKLNGNEYWGAFQVPADINLGNYQKERKGFNVEEHMMREERVNQPPPPPWLFHCLSLKMT